MTGARRQPHTDLVRVCLEWLELNRIPAWQNNTGAVVIKDKKTGKKRLLRFGMKGTADILGILPGEGKFLAVECKIPPHKPTAEQETFRETINEAGGVAIVVESVDELIAALEDWRH